MVSLAPNGLPYATSSSYSNQQQQRTQTTQDDAHTFNEWARRDTKLLAKLPIDPVRSLHPAVIARHRADVGGGMGLFATMGIRKNQVLWAEKQNAGPDVTAIPRSRAWIDALPPASKKAFTHFMYKTGDDQYQSLAEFNNVAVEDFPNVPTVDVSNYMNHSCDPTCWFVQGGAEYAAEYAGLMVAMRDILPGEEITYDYCTSEDCDLSPEYECLCGSNLCRGRITPDDWAVAALQERYDGHFLPHIAARIAEQRRVKGGTPADGDGPGPVPLVSLSPEHLRSTWWLRLDADSAASRRATTLDVLEVDRRALISKAPTAEELELLNRQAAAIISHYKLRAATYDEGDPRGRYVETGEAISAGSLAMLLPPNLLLWEEEVDDFNTCLQIGVTATGARLFSSSLTPYDLDNFLDHSCEPNCTVVIGKDLAAGLVARWDIPANTSLTFDYDTTEDDLRGDRGGFECNCGAASCRRHVLGRLYSPTGGAPRYCPELQTAGSESRVVDALGASG